MKRRSSLMLVCCAILCGTTLFIPTRLAAQISCDSLFYDTGGVGNNYSNNERDTTVICPGSNLDVAILLFPILELAKGDTLTVYNGNSTSWPALAKFIGEGSFTATLKATTATGCLTFVFHADTAATAAGWIAQTLCATPSSCYPVVGASVGNIRSTSARLSWAAMFNADHYGIQIGVTPFVPGGVAVINDTTSNTIFPLTGLTEATVYDAYIKTYCNSGDSSNWTYVPFFTLPEFTNVPTIQCGSAGNNASSIGTGVFNSPVCAIPTPGREKIFRFRAPNTRMYSFGVSQTLNSLYAGYFYKPVSEGFSATGWRCIEDFNQPDTFSFGPLTAGTEYFIRFEPQTPSLLTQQRFGIFDCKPTNDEASNAIALTIDLPCAGNVYSNDGASTFPGEPDPDEDPSDGVTGRWRNPIDRTVWFRFAAPASGTVTITTDVVPPGGNNDTQIALYTAADSSDYATFTLLESDEDSGELAGNGYNAEMSYTGLTPDSTYYIQMDGYGIILGSFCLEVLNKAPRAVESNCAVPGYSVTGVNGLASGGNRWYNIYTTPNVLEIGDIVAAIKPGEQDLGTVSVQLNVTDTIPIAQNVTPYMPAYYNFSSTLPAIAPVQLRLFYYNAEFDRLKLVAAEPAATIDDLNVTNYEGPDEDCNQLNNNFGVGLATYIPTVTAVPMGASGTFYLEVQVPSLGEVGAHLARYALPLELKSFTGAVQGAINLLRWETLTERNVREHRVERSADGLQWTVIGRQAGAGNSAARTNYQLEDRTPLPVAYYRLRSVDYDGTAAISQLIRLVRPNDRLAIAGLYPTPATDRLQVQYLTENEQVTSLRILDLMGKTMQETRLEPVKGANHTTLSVSTLPPGVYLLYLANGTESTTPMRIVKQ